MPSISSLFSSLLQTKNILSVLLVAGLGTAAVITPIIPQNIAGLLTKDGKPVTSQTLVTVDKDGKKTEVQVTPNQDGKFATSTNSSLLELLTNKAQESIICAKDSGVIINGTLGCVPAITIATNETPQTLQANPDKIKSSFTENDVQAFQQPSFAKSASANGVSQSVINGLNGASGKDGLAGLNGAGGANGKDGTSGSNGSNGTNGNDGQSGSNGSTGQAGANGTNGTQGNAGSNGSNGTSGSNGTNGISGANGSNGTSGSNGSNGTDGNNGTQGLKGDKGDKGDDGSNGTNGTNGSTGATGPQGTQGIQGTPGPQGTQGIQGTPGVLTTTSDTNITGSLTGTNLTLGFTGQLSTARGGTGLATIGTSGQLLAVNGAGTGLEYVNPATFSNVITSVFGRTGAITAANGDYTTSQVTEGTNLYYTSARANTDFDSRLTSKSTSDLAEGTNLYFTPTRADNRITTLFGGLFDTAFGNKTTTDLTEGTNLYYTPARFDTSLASKTTDSLTEGTTNKYFSNSLARASVSAGTGLSYNSGTGAFSLSATTSDIAEGSNLYYTPARFNSAFTAKTTTDLAEGSNLYYTDVRADARITAQKGVNSGIASLDATGKVPSSQLPGIVLNNTFVVGSEASQTALSANVGDIAVRTDENKTYVLQTSPATTFANWTELLSPNSVTSVNGQTGIVSLTTTDVAEGTNLYYTDARADARFNTLAAGNFTTQFATKTTDNLTEGSTNLYYTPARVNTAFDTRLATKTTDNLTEGATNKYFSNAQARNALSAGTGLSYNAGTGSFTLNATTNEVTEGANLYYTQARFDSALTAKSTDNLTEGLSNLYFTNARADARITAQKGFNNGIASLDSSGKVPTSQLPGVVINNTFVVASQAAQTALSANIGDLAIRTDENKTYILQSSPASTFSNWTELLSPSSVTSVNGQTGAVSLTTSNINEGTNLYYTDARTDARFNLLAPTSFNTAFATKTTTDLAEGANLYYTQGRFDSAFTAKTTTGLTEGANLYFTDARARAALSVAGTPLTYNNATGQFGINQANTTTDGFLTAADWTTFNGKQSALTFSTGLTNTAGTISVNPSQNITTLSNLTTAGVVKTNASGLLSSGLVNQASDVTGILAVANGGTGSSTQNFVDLTTAQTVAGNKTLSGNTTLAGTLSVTGNQTNTGKLAVAQALSLAKGTDFSTTGTTNDAALGNASLIRLTGASAQTLTGIVAGSDGQILTLINAGSNAANLTNSDVASSAVNRIATGTGATLSLGAGASVQLVYDSGSSLWRVVGGTGGSGGGGTSAPTVDTTAISNPSTTGGSTGGNITATGGAVITASGVVYGTSGSPTISGTKTVDTVASGPFVSVISGLTPATTYYIRAYATNSVGTSYGPQITFNTGTATTSTFNYTGGVQNFTVPANVTSITINAKGAGGISGTTNAGGTGGSAAGTLAVTPGQSYSIYVGGTGSTSTGGFNGGGNGVGSWGGGGGASDVRFGGAALANRIIVGAGGGGGNNEGTNVNINGTGPSTGSGGGSGTFAAGGGGNCGANYCGGGGGKGYGYAGGPGGVNGGTVSTATNGGGAAGGGLNSGGQGAVVASVQTGASGTLGQGGAASAANCAHGGGGGGGYYGGGGAAGFNCGSGQGGGGSSWTGTLTSPSFAVNATASDANGQIQITYINTSSSNSAGVVIGSTLDYIQAKVSASYNTNITTNDHIKYDTVVSSSGNASLDTSTTYVNTANTSSLGRFTLKSGKTYRLTADLGQIDYVVCANQSRIGWYNSDTGTQIGESRIFTDLCDADTPSQTIDAIYTPTVDSRVEVRILAAGAGFVKIGANGYNTVSLPTVIIQQLGSTTAFTGGTTTSIDKLLAAGAINTIDNGNFGQTWNWTTATTQNGLTLGASGLTTGSLLNLNNTSTANTGLTINAAGSVAYKKGADFTTVGTTNNADFGNTSLVRLTGATAQTITGIAGGSDGELLTIINAGTTAATITNSDVLSVAANRIITGTGASLNLAAGATTQVVYDSGANLWRIVGGTGGGGSNIANGATINSGNGLTFNNTANTFGTTLVAGANTSNLTFTLPTSTGSAGQVLTTNGTGGLSFTTVSGGLSSANVTYSEAITAGDLIEINSSGQAKKIVQTVGGASTGVQTVGTSDVATLGANTITNTTGQGFMVSKAYGADKILTLYKKTGVQDLYAIVGTVSGTNTTWGSPVLVSSGGADSRVGGIVDLGSGNVAIGYTRSGYLYLRSATVSGSGVSGTLTSLGTEYNASSNLFHANAIVPLSPNKVMQCSKYGSAFGGDDTVYCYASLFNGSTWTTGGQSLSTSHGDQLDLVQVGADQALVAYQRGSGNGYDTIVSNLMVSGTSVTSTSVSTGSNCEGSSTCYSTSLTQVDTGKFVVEEYRSNSSNSFGRKMRVVSVGVGSGSAPTLGSSINTGNSSLSYSHSTSYSPSTGVLVNNSEDSTGAGTYSIYTISGTAITSVSASNSWYSLGYGTSQTGRRTTTGHAGKVYSVTANSAGNLVSRVLQMGAATSVSPSGTFAVAQTTAGSGATGTIALPGQTSTVTGAGYTPGTLYYVQANGSIGATPTQYLLGRAISSTQLHLSNDAFSIGGTGAISSTVSSKIADTVNGNTGIDIMENGFDYNRIRFTNNGAVSGLFNETNQLILGGDLTSGTGLLSIQNVARTTQAFDIVANSVTTNNVAAITANSLTSGAGLRIDTASGSKNIQFAAGGTTAGNITSTGSTTAFNTTSDQRLKTDTGLSAKGLEDLLGIKVHNFTWNETGEVNNGFFAQELYNIFPEAVTVGSNEKDKNGKFINPWSVDYGKVTPLLVKGVQELNTKVDTGFKVADANDAKFTEALSNLGQDIVGIKSITNTSGEGLKITNLNDRLTAQGLQIASLNDKVKLIEDKNTLQDTVIVELKAKLDAGTTGVGLSKEDIATMISDTLKEGGLAKLSGDQTFTGIITFAKDVNVKGDLEVDGQLTVGDNVAQVVTIRAGTTKASVSFDKTKVYTVAPIVTATPKSLITGNYAVVDPSLPSSNLKGFDIELAEAQTKDVQFNVIVLGK